MRKTIIKHFMENDVILGRIALNHAAISLKPSDNYFRDLAQSIICQQLSEKAGATIWMRFTALFNDTLITPKLVKTKTTEELRSVGMSYSKARYIHNIADAYLQKAIDFPKFPKYTDEQVIAELTKIKGIGRWTAEMFLIFSLAREDIFSSGDAGLLRAIRLLYGNKRTLTPIQIQKLSARWSPYRSYASLLLWKSLD
jgi:DNA-3-methyladenine glycosylase II